MLNESKVYKPPQKNLKPNMYCPFIILPTLYTGAIQRLVSYKMSFRLSLKLLMVERYLQLKKIYKSRTIFIYGIYFARRCIQIKKLLFFIYIYGLWVL